MNLRYAPLLLLLAPALAFAQRPSIQVEPELCVHEPFEFAGCINNDSTDVSEPYGDCSAEAPCIEPSFFYRVETVGDTVDLGVVYTPEGVTGDLALAFTADGGIDACEEVTNDLSGQIAFVERGQDCLDLAKARNAEDAGAVGVVIFFPEGPGQPPGPCDFNPFCTDSLAVSIPVAFLSRFVALPLLTALDNGETVNATLRAYDRSTADAPDPDPALALTVAPNPASGAAALVLRLPTAQVVRVEAFDTLGRRVVLLHDGPLAGGPEHRLILDGRALPAGAYLVRATGERFVTARRVTLLR